MIIAYPLGERVFVGPRQARSSKTVDKRRQERWIVGWDLGGGGQGQQVWVPMPCRGSVLFPWHVDIVRCQVMCSRARARDCVCVCDRQADDKQTV